MPPVVVPCAADTWVKVATAVTSATIHKIGLLPGVYKWTYVANLAAAPTDDSDAVLAFGDKDLLEFIDSASSDVYIKAVKKDGSVRVDA